MADDGQILAYGSGHLRVATLVDRKECEVDLEDVYYTSRVHERFLSMGKLEDQGWDFSLCMDLRDYNGDLFADIVKVNKVSRLSCRQWPQVQGWLAGRLTLGKASQLTRSCWNVLGRSP